MWFRRGREETVLPSEDTQWRYGPADMAVSALILAATVGVCLPVASRLRAQTLRLDAQREQAMERCRQINSSLHALGERREASSRLRRASSRLAAEIQARPRVAWGDVVGELSRRKPQGVWAVRLTGDGARFRAELEAERPELVEEYVRNLAAAPVVEFAGVPQAGAGGRLQVFGRMRGE